MAYKKSLQLANGFTAEYWRITQIDANKLASKIDVVISGYKDQATREANGRAVTSKTFSIPTSELDFGGDLFAQAYEYIKAHKETRDMFNQKSAPFFSDAQNA